MNRRIEVISGQRDGMIKLEIPLDLLRKMDVYFVEENGIIGQDHEYLKSAICDVIEQAELGGIKSLKRRDIDWDFRDRE